MRAFQKHPMRFVLLATFGLIVIVIVVLVAYVSDLFSAYHSAVAATIENREKIVAALGRYYADHSAYPASLNDLVPAYLSSIPEQLVTPNTGWQYKSTLTQFVFGYLDWPDKMGTSWICSYSSDKPEWYCAPGNFEPFGEIPTPYPKNFYRVIDNG